MYTQEQNEPTPYSAQEEVEVEQQYDEPEGQSEPIVEQEQAFEEQQPVEASYEEEEPAELAPPPPKPKKKHIGERLREVTREKFQALGRINHLEEENARLRSMADASTKTALNHYDQSVNQRLAAAKEQQRKALESGDIDAQVEAQANLSMATNEYQNLLTMKAQAESYDNNQQYQNQYQPYQQQQQQYQQSPEVMERAQRFVNENPWFDKYSEDFDEDMFSRMNAYAEEFEYNMTRAGQGHRIGSDEYYQILGNAARQISQSRHNPQRSEIPMRQSRSPVAPARSSSSTGMSGQYPRQQKQMKLGPEQREMARLLKQARPDLTEEMLVQYIDKDMRERPEKYGRR